MNHVYYLACPYNHPDAAVRAQRYNACCRAYAELARKGRLVLCSVLMTHHAAEWHGLPKDWKWWWSMNEALLMRCQGLIVLTLDGWMESKGVTKEIWFALERKDIDMPIEYMLEV